MISACASRILKGSLAGLVLTITIYSLAWAGPVYQTRVRVVSADNGPARTDPGIQDMIKEIGPVFKYTRFILLSDKTMLLPQGQKKVMPLPGARRLSITPQGMQNTRILYHLRVDAGKSPIFDTNVGINNNTSITIGGPKIQNGVMLINIQGRTR
nr:hypothetical protein [uncultured Desulfobacter sp.]